MESDQRFQSKSISVFTGAATDLILGYDELGRVTGSSQAIAGGAALPFSYTYNLADALVQTTYPTGRVVTNSYDAANRINGVTGVINGNSTPYVSGTCSSGICYAASGAPSGFAYGNSVARAYTYNSRLQPTAITDTLSSSTLLSLAYTFGVTTATNNGNPSRVVIGGSGSGSSGYTQTYTYDPLNRLHTFGDNGGSGVAQTLSYDQFGNMWQSGQTGLSGTVPALAGMPTAQSSINAANNQLTSAVGAAYDSGGGNQTSFLSATMTYDAENRQVQVESGTGTYYYYTYDGLGARVSRTVGSGTPTYYVHDAFGNLASEYNPPAAAACGTCYLSWDHLGSTRMVTDGSTGAIVARHDFLPFGVEIPSGVAGRSGVWNVTDGLSPKFTGQDHDSETFLEFFQARYMASGQGRFMSLDPGNAGADITDPQSWNMYGYVRNSPMNFIDPSGMAACSDGSADCDSSGDFNSTLPTCFDDPFICGFQLAPTAPGGNGPPPDPSAITPWPGTQQSPGSGGVGNCAFNACQAQPAGPRLPVSGINIAALINFANCNVVPQRWGNHDCSSHVYAAFRAAGADFHGQTFHNGKDWGPLLGVIGCPALARQPEINNPDYSAQAGDVIVFQGVPGNVNGHVAIWNGTNWVSDFPQTGNSGVYPNQTYKNKNATYQVYRCH